MTEKRDPHDGEYIGNIFGPKITLYGAIVILFFVAVVVYRHWALDVPFGMEEDALSPSEVVQPDTIPLTPPQEQ